MTSAKWEAWDDDMPQILKASGRRLGKSLTDLSGEGRVFADKDTCDISFWFSQEQFKSPLSVVMQEVQRANTNKKMAFVNSKSS